MKQLIEMFVTTFDDGISIGIDRAIKNRAGVEAFGYRFEVAEFERKSGFPSKARLVQVSAPAVQAWTGEGAPPAGTVCEVDGSASSDGWGRCVIKYSTEWVTIFTRIGSDVELAKYPDQATFRPIRTPEQIAAEAKLEAAKELYCAINWDNGEDQWLRLSVSRKADYLKAIEAGWQKVSRA